MEEISLDTLSMNPSSDFGGGVEFLMNDKKKDVSKVSIEEELKEFEMNIPSPRMKQVRMENTSEPIQIGKDTASIDTFQQSSEGFRHINDIHVEQEMKPYRRKAHP
jgi:hypothetical protein